MSFKSTYMVKRTGFSAPLFSLQFDSNLFLRPHGASKGFSGVALIIKLASGASAPLAAAAGALRAGGCAVVKWADRATTSSVSAKNFSVCSVDVKFFFQL